ncbi:MAG: T9SS type A sorting domain-containing protein [Candidatus Cloacimonadota bacterium]|nr:MAG: T9SS type A sorting domain-containing protein [Candidatus Cloacimonadota bacterium]
MKKIIIICFILLTGFISALTAHNWENPFLRSTEFLIDTNIIYVPVNGYYPSLAFDGTNYLVVWNDMRYTNIVPYSRGYSDIFGARVNQSGELIDSAGIPISINPHSQGLPDVAFDGTNYLIVWVDSRCDTSEDIYGARVSLTGMVLDTAGIMVSTDEYDQHMPSVAFGINSYLVVWGHPNMGGIKGIRIATDGSILDTVSIEISSFPLGQHFPDITFDGRDFFVVWDFFGGDILGALVDTSGNVLDTTDIPISMADGNQMFPSVAFDGRKYFVVWGDQRNSPPSYDLYGARVDTTGFVIDTAGIPIYTLGEVYVKPSITYGITNYLVAFQDRGHYIKCTRVDTSGTVLDTTGIMISATSSGPPSVTFDGVNYLAAWSDGAVKATRIDTSGVVLDSSYITISTEAYPQSCPSSVFDGRNYFVVWQDKRNGEDYDIYGARVDTTGVILDPNCISISTEIVNQQYPKIAFSGSNYLVVWQDDRYGNINGARVDTSGVVLDSFGITISGAPDIQESPSIAFDGRHYFVVWLDERDPDDVAIYGARVDTSGFVLDPSGIQISHHTYYSERNPSIGFNGLNCLVVWFRSGDMLLCGALVDTAGQVIDTLIISEYYEPFSHPSVTSDGSDYFVVWKGYTNWDRDIFGARIDASGTVLDTAGIPIATADWLQENPTVAFDGTDYIVLWEDYRNVFSDIHGARVSTEGLVLDTFSAVTQEGNQFSPALSKGPGDEFLVTYSGFVDSINSRPANTMRIWGNLFIPPVGVKEDKPISKPFHFSLKQNFPNPVFNETKIRFQIPEITKVENFPVSLSIYDLSGRLIKVFSLFTPHSSLITTVTWDCRDGKGKQVSNGIYFYRLTAGKKTAVRKMVVIR